MWRGSTSFSDTSGRASVVVELWEIGHHDADMSFATGPSYDSPGVRVVKINHAEIRRSVRLRREGDRYTRTLVTLSRDEVARHRLEPYRPRSVMVDALFPCVSADPVARRVGARHGHMWCHLWCAPGDEAELHALAARIGLRRAWFQDKPGFPHYDLVPTRRAAAIRAGAEETDLREWLE